MASSLNAATSGGGGVIVTSDASGDLNIQSGGSTVVAVTSTGVAVTGTLSSSGASTFTGTGKFATTIGVGNATPSASGSGITFPATQSASSDANTLDDYEEGTFTVTDQSGAGLTFSNNTGRYVKVGGLVYFAMDVIFPTTASVANIVLSLPFQSGTSCAFSAAVGYSNAGFIPSAYIGISQSRVVIYSTTGVAVTNVTFSGKELAISGCYPTT
jgi:hypothetical protein